MKTIDEIKRRLSRAWACLLGWRTEAELDSIEHIIYLQKELRDERIFWAKRISPLSPKVKIYSAAEVPDVVQIETSFWSSHDLPVVRHVIDFQLLDEKGIADRLAATWYDMARDEMRRAISKKLAELKRGPGN